MFRINEGLEEMDIPPIDGDDALEFVEEGLPINFREIWEMEGQVDFASFLEKARRFRVNVFRLVKEGKVSKRETLQSSLNCKGLDINLKAIYLSESNRIIRN